jgi:hypothetical protein
MSRRTPVPAALLLALTALTALTARAAPLAAQAIDPFYLDVERDGRAALARGEPVEAARLLRIACFGQLEAPPRLGACTAALAIAQGRANDREGFEESIRRLIALESRFPGASAAHLDAGARAELARRAAAWLAPELRGQLPLLATAEESAPAPAPRAEARRREPSLPEPAPAPRESRRERRARERTTAAAAADANPDTAAAAADAQPDTAPAEPAPDPPLPVPEPPSAPAPRTPAEVATLAAARRAVAGTPTLDEVSALLAELAPLADRHAHDPEPARLVALLAYRASRWPLCADSFRRAGDPGPEEPLLRFYMAVCLHESGDRPAAAELLRDSAAALPQTPFVQGYLRRILGDDGSGR